MNRVYEYMGCSKQSFHQRLDRELRQKEMELLLLPIIEQLRADHPCVAARQLYWIIKPEGIGRDRFERLCFSHGYKLPKTKSFTRTTDSNGVVRFANLIVGRELTGINQIWSSDITYFQISDRFYYLTFIIDLFSRRIVGFNVSERLFTEHTTLPALMMALSERNPGRGLIFHSDGGSQYYCKAFLKVTSEWKIKNSMCEMAYENPHAERINGTIKNQYLKGYAPTDFLSLKKMTSRAVYNYNYVKPHSSLKKLSPVDFEQTMPAGGSSSATDKFCIDSNSARHHQKNYQSQLRSTLVKKTVNVFQA
jgi:putative transposase